MEVSVVINTYNRGPSLRQTLLGLRHQKYRHFEVIVVIDGSTDDSAKIAGEFPFRVVHCQKNGGLSNARNVGMREANGEIVAYIDDDAYPDPHWLRRLAIAFQRSDHAGIGGPNLPPPGDGMLAECVANSPGNPLHVLLTDEVAEHVPGCNMAFRRRCLLAIDGFDVRDRLHRITVPTLVLCGDGDTGTPSAGNRRIAELIPGARYIELENARHTPMVEYPELFAGILLDWLETHR